MPKKTVSLTLKERRFIDAYLGSCNGNGTEAILAAGYRFANRNVAGVEANRHLKKPKIKALIAERQQKRTDSEIADADERDRILTKIARSTLGAKERISAVKELNKCTGRHSLQHLHKLDKTLEQILSESRE